MSQAQDFFRELENFLPKYVPAIPSYVHASLAFLFALSIGIYTVNSMTDTETNDETNDDDSDGDDSSYDRKIRRYALLGVATLVSLFVADVAFDISWKTRNKINRKHLIYQRWFR